MSRPPHLFISHASSDESLAGAVANLLRLGTDLASDQVVCTSLDGLGLEPGAGVSASLRASLAEATLVVALISKMYEARPYCLCELGGAWATGVRLVPLTVGSVDPTSFQHVLKDVVAKPLDDSAALDDLRDEVHRAFETKPAPSALWNDKRRRFLAELPSILSDLPTPDLVPRKEVEDAIAETAELLDVVASRDREIERLESLLEKVRGMKNAREVAMAELESLGADEQFEALTAAVRERVEPFHPVIRDVLFHSFNGKDYEVDRDYPSEVDAVNDALDRGLIREISGAFRVDTDDPKAERAMTALRDLDGFLKRTEGAFWDWYIDQFDHRPEMRIRTLWEQHLGL